MANIHLKKQLTNEVLQKLVDAKLIKAGTAEIQPLSSRQVNKLASILKSSGNAKAADALQQTVGSYKPLFRIISPDKADELIGTAKTYRGTLEMESKFPVGAKIDRPAQALFTRIGPESTRVELWLDKPLSARQIAKLKVEGLAEVFRQPFRQPLKIKYAGKGLTKKQTQELASIIKEAGNPGVARSLERAYSMARSQRSLMQLTTRAGIREGFLAPDRYVSVTMQKRKAQRVKAIRQARQLAWTERLEMAARAEREGRVEEAERIRRELREEGISRGARETRGERTGRTTRAERGTRAERVTRAERLERPTKPIRPTRPIRPVRPARPVRPVRPIRPTKLTKMLDMPPVKGKQAKKRQGPALATWKQGMYWVSVFPPFRTKGKKEDVVYSKRKPPWGSVIAKGRHAPKKTLKSIGKVPKLIEVPMGATVAQIRNGRKLTFRHRRRGKVIKG